MFWDGRGRNEKLKGEPQKINESDSLNRDRNMEIETG